MNAAMSLATMKPSQVTSGVNADFFEDIGPMANLGIHSVQKTFVDDVKPLDIPFDTKGGAEQLHSINATQSWHTLDNVTIPHEQATILSPSVGGKLELAKHVIPMQVPAAGEVLVKVGWTGVCGSDVLFSIGPQEGYRAKNHIAGHEGIGHIVRSQDSSLLGLPVAMRYLASYCRSCTDCLQNLPECCEEQTNFPKHYQGTFQQYVTAPVNSLMPLPRYVFQENKATSKDGNQISPAVYTSALCSGAAALRSLKNLNVRPGSLVVISGIGGSIGHLAGQLARKVFNLKVIGVDWAHKRENLCHPGSITSDVFDIFVPAPENESQQDTYQQNIFLACVELRGSNIKPRKADGLIITASSAAAYNRISDYVCSGGSIVCVGVPKTKVIVNIPLTDLVERGIGLHGGLMGGWEESYEVMEYIRTGQIRPITTEITLDQVPGCMQGFADYKNVGKIIVRVDEGITA